MSRASISAHERQLKAAQREADIDKVATLERQLVSVHKESFSKAERRILPSTEEVDPGPIEAELEREAGVSDLMAQLGGGEMLPVAAPPEPVDRYELMRVFRKRRRRGIPFWRLRDQIEAARQADRGAEEAAEHQVRERVAAQAAEQARLDLLWENLQRARAKVTDQLPQRVTAEKERRDADRAAEQKELDETWEMLLANDPGATLPALERAFADNETPATAIGCEADRTTVVMQFPAPEAIVPERKPARTPTGRRTLKKRTKTEINMLYLEALGSNVLATVKEAFAVAPGTQLIRLMVARMETGERHAGQLAPIFAGEFDRDGYERASGSRDPGRALALAPEALLNLKGKTAQVAPLDLSDREDLQALLRELQQRIPGR
jgi:hypothetical protein